MLFVYVLEISHSHYLVDSGKVGRKLNRRGCYLTQKQLLDCQSLKLTPED